jgi:hypothetical protein
MATSKSMQIDTNINNYTYPELLIILDLDDPTNTSLIIKETNAYIEKYTRERNDRMIIFFNEIQEKLLDYAKQLATSGEDAEYGPSQKQTEKWIKNIESLPQANKVQTDKITDRFQKIGVYSNNHVPMNRETLGVNNTYDLPVAQDGKLNPTLKNTTQRLIVLDSFFRQESSGPSISTDYTLDLSDHLTDVLSLRLWSIEVPLTYYVIDVNYGNTCFWVSDASGGVINNIAISIPSGNYTPSTFVTALNDAFAAAGFAFISPVIPVSYNSSNYKITMKLNGGNYTPPVGSTTTAFTINPITTRLIFFDPTLKLQCEITCVQHGLYLNQTLGWLMGYHNSTIIENGIILQTGAIRVDASGNTADSVLDLNGPRYFILALDDYNQNHLNNGLVSITEPSKVVKLPSYYSPDQPYICEPSEFGQVAQLTQSSPRTLTQSQIYTINEILKNNVNNMELRAKAPTTTDVFAIIPIKQSSVGGTLYVDFSGQLQDNRRTYFGPVDIDRMRIRLLNDKGNVVNLNGADWAITIISENLYQY